MPEHDPAAPPCKRLRQQNCNDTTAAQRGHWTKHDRLYFERYDSAFVHEEMLRDGVRCRAYAEAMSAHRSVLAGGVVLEVGAGSGVLSCLCAKLGGASKVYAVEASAAAAQVCREVIAQNGLQNVVEVLEGRLEDIDTPLPGGETKVDAVISEWMGYFLLFESMLDSVLLARDRWLRPGGLMLPSRARLLLCPFSDSYWRKQREGMLRNVCGVDVSPLAVRLVQEEASEPAIQGVEASQLLGEPCCALELDLQTMALSELAGPRSARLCWPSSSPEAVRPDGFVGWFEVLFEPPPWSPEDLLGTLPLHSRFVPSSAASVARTLKSLEHQKRSSGTGASASGDARVAPLRRTVVLSTAPDRPRTCWHQTLFYWPEEEALELPLEAELHLSRPEESPRFLLVKLEICKRQSAIADTAAPPSRVARHEWLLRTYAPECTKGPPLPVARLRGTSRAACFGGAR
eukprot:TRINITY_DN18483_c0_g1_i4.p1 TRINITY_DN18483_c0_g1~~TRINITY_DN18483_c0_g1_i4.p1  ORF type:complete len:459 (+),score=87.23 TRINITY_DN18483_c0_g1_i4:59-1435(+)